MDGGLVDVHTHFLPRALAEALERRSGFPRIERRRDGSGYIHYGPNSGHPLVPAMERLDVRLADMDRQGIGTAILCVTVPGVDSLQPAEATAVARAVNEELAALTASSDGRLAALAVLPGQAPEAAATELERAAGDGLVGAAVFSNVRGEPLDTAERTVLFDAVAGLDVPMLLHPTFPLSAAALDAYALIPTLGFLVDTTTAVLRLVLGGLYERHPGFKLVVPHTASLIPWLVGRIDYEGERMPNGLGVLSEPPSVHLRRLYADIVSDWTPAVRLLVDFLGPDRVMYGSDYPFWDPARATRTLGEAGLDDRVRAGTARTLFRLGAPSGARAG